MPSTKLSSRIKIAFLNIMQAFGSAASHLASNAKLRVQEINLEARRHEILTEFSLQAFELWHGGTKLPKQLSDMFVELSELDDKLSVLRAQKYAKVPVECEVASEDGSEPIPAACEIDMPNPQPPAEPEETQVEAEKEEEPKAKRSTARRKAKPKTKA